ncbi:MAG: CPBP family intramembrane metalloprotease [Acidobacteria bacterium]|nr:CPBP family intramembrane metalloprotease [Acidobacteriota bacterium]
MAALAGAGMILSTSMLGALSFLWIERAFPGSIPRLDYGLSRSRWVALLLITVVAPFSEEIVFRGIFLRGFAARYGIVRGIALSSPFFACAHGSLARIPHTFALGAVLGSIYVQTRSLWASVGGHMLNNLVVGLVVLLGAQQLRKPFRRFSEANWCWPPFASGFFFCRRTHFVVVAASRRIRIPPARRYSG